MVTSVQSIEELMLTEEGRFLEVHRGELREKPTAMSEGHYLICSRVARQLFLQLDADRYDVRLNSSRVRRGEQTYYIPDVFILPLIVPPSLRTASRQLEVFDQPLPLVVEVWSPSTGAYDVEEKLPEYMRRGDLEIWRIHPFELTLTAWRRQADGTYEETLHRSGRLPHHAIPGATIDLDALFA